MGTQDVVFQTKDSAQNFNQIEILEDGALKTGLGTAAPATYNSWTPVMTRAGGSGTAVFTMATNGQVGRYFRIGNIVWINAHIIIDSVASAQSDDTVTVTGLPIAASDDTNYKQGLTCTGLSNVNGPTDMNLQAYVIPTSTSAIQLTYSADDGNEVVAASDNFDKGSPDAAFMISGFYFTDA